MYSLQQVGWHLSRLSQRGLQRPLSEHFLWLAKDGAAAYFFGKCSSDSEQFF